MKVIKTLIASLKVFCSARLRNLRSYARATAIIAIVISLATTFAWADEPAQHDASEILFARRIAPLLREKCMGCHGPENQKGKLRLDLPEYIKSGGESGPAVVAGKPGDNV